MSAVWARLTGAGGTVESGGGLAKRDREWRGVCAGAPFCSSNPDRSTLQLSFATVDVGKIPRVNIVVASIKPRTWGGGLVLVGNSGPAGRCGVQCVAYSLDLAFHISVRFLKYFISIAESLNHSPFSLLSLKY